MNVKIAQMAAAALLFFAGTVAQASETFRLPISLKSQRITFDQQLKDTCYKLAAQGTHVRDEYTKPKGLFTSTFDMFTWKVTELSSGLVCKVLVEGGYDLQFGSGVDDPGCECKGEAEIVR